MNKPTVAGLAGVVLITENLAAQRHLFGEVLGLPIVWSASDAHVFKLGTAAVGFFEASHHPEAISRLGVARHGISHLEFAVTRGSRADVQQLLVRHVAGDNIFKDGDGNLFHLVEN